MTKIFGKNEADAVQFFKDLIDLSASHYRILDRTARNSTLTQESASFLLHDILHSDHHRHLLSPDLPALDTLRTSIHALAYHNLIIVVGMSVQPRSTTLPPECTSSARTTLNLIISSRTPGLTMCLWMWLYYAFTAAVAIFIHALALTYQTPLDLDTDNIVNDVALLSDLHALCVELGTSSSSAGAARVGKIARDMETALWEVMKRMARKRARAPTVSDGEDVGRTGKIRKVVATPEEGVRTPADIFDIGTAALAVPAAAESQPAEIQDPHPSMADILDSSPRHFEWNEWDQWIEELNFE